MQMLDEFRGLQTKYDYEIITFYLLSECSEKCNVYGENVAYMSEKMLYIAEQTGADL